MSAHKKTKGEEKKDINAFINNKDIKESKNIQRSTENDSVQLWSPSVADTLKSAQAKTLKRKRTTSQRKKTKMNESESHLQQIKLLASKTQILVGIDMSITSPGMVMIDRNRLVCKIVAFQQNPTQAKNPAQAKDALQLQSKHFQLSNLLSMKNDESKQESKPTKPTKPTTIINTTIELLTAPASKDDPTRFHIITQLLVDQIQLFVQESESKNTEKPAILSTESNTTKAAVTASTTTSLPKLKSNVLILMENYAFNVNRGANQSSSQTQLCEISGILKNKLFTLRYQTELLPPATIKGWFTGNGLATKFDMWTRFESLTKPNMDLKELISGCFNTKVPSPHSDIADAFALVYPHWMNNCCLNKTEQKKAQVSQRRKMRIKASEEKKQKKVKSK